LSDFLHDINAHKLPNVAVWLVFYNRHLLLRLEVCNFVSHTLLRSIAELDKLKENAVSYKIQQFTILANKILVNISKQIEKRNWN